jgi:hypothetical protein
MTSVRFFATVPGASVLNAAGTPAGCETRGGGNAAFGGGAGEATFDTGETACGAEGARGGAFACIDAAGGIIHGNPFGFAGCFPPSANATGSAGRFSGAAFASGAAGIASGPVAPAGTADPGLFSETTTSSCACAPGKNFVYSLPGIGVDSATAGPGGRLVADAKGPRPAPPVTGPGDAGALGGRFPSTTSETGFTDTIGTTGSRASPGGDTIACVGTPGAAAKGLPPIEKGTGDTAIGPVGKVAPEGGTHGLGGPSPAPADRRTSPPPRAAIGGPCGNVICCVFCFETFSGGPFGSTTGTGPWPVVPFAASGLRSTAA